MTPASATETLLGGRGGGAPGWYRAAIAVLAAFLVLYHLYIGLYGPPTNVVFLTVHFAVALALLFLVHPLGRKWHQPLVAASAIDLAAAGAALAILLYTLIELDTWDLRMAGLTPTDRAIAAVAVLLVLEAVRRTVGWALIVISGLFMAHALFADRFPGVFFGPPVTVENLLVTLFIGDAGLFGVPMQVMAQYLVLFLLFGRLLQQTGAGAFFSRLAFALFGHRVGGPAKAAVVSSALFGTMSGSGVSNVLTTGSFTIPMMRRLGYRAPFAGGVEASAAVGGAIMPPVMGAVAFMMAEFMGVPYVEIAIAAAIPAFLYYFAIYWTVHFEAKRHGLASIPRADLPDPLRVLRREGYLAIPLLTIIVLMLVGYSIILVAVFASAVTFLLSFAAPGTRLSPSRVADAVEATGRSTGSLTATCACAGIIIGSIFATGLSFQVSQAVIALAQDRLWLLLLVSALIALVLGTGLTASAVYITMVATVIPILKLAGVSNMAAHMFAFYFGVVADITPPTALAAVAAAAIARSNPLSTMLEASRLGIAAFIVPVLFVYAPGLLMVGSAIDVITASASAALGLLALSAALAGHLLAPLAPWQRAAFLGGAGLLIAPGIVGDLVGLALLGLGAAPDLLGRSRAPVALAAGAAPAAVPEEAPPPPRTWFQRWVAARIAREEPEEAEGVVAGDVEKAAASQRDLVRFLNESEERSAAAPPDSFLWPAWAALMLPVAAIGLMGRASLHATHPLRWLAGLALVAAATLAAMALIYRRAARRP